MSSRPESSPEMISGDHRRLASQSPSPDRTPIKTIKPRFFNTIGSGDQWYPNGNVYSTFQAPSIGGAGDDPTKFCDYYDADHRLVDQFDDLDICIEPPPKFADGYKKGDVDLSSCGDNQKRSSRERRKNGTDRNGDVEPVNTVQDIQPYLGPIGKGRGRTFTEEQGKGRGSRLPDQFSMAPPPWIPGIGLGPTTLHIPKGRGSFLKMDRKSADDGFCGFVPPPPAYRDPRSDESAESKPTSLVDETSTNADDCCGGGAEESLPRVDISSPRIKTHYRRRAHEYFEMRKHEYDSTYIDTHCHLDLVLRRDGFHGSYSEYMKKKGDSWAKCYEGCIADFCYPVSFETTKPLWESLMEETGVYAAFGCHPHVATDYSDDMEKWIIDRLSHPKVIALGEMGLDYSRNNQQNHELQKEIFKKQLTLAKNYNKPLVIHCREAEDDCYEIMKECVPHDYRIHRHCFTGSLEESRRWTDYFTNLKIGLTTGVYEPRGNQSTLLQDFPLDRILIETDSPYFLPRYARQGDFGGLSHNHPGIGYVVAAKLAEVRNVEMSHVLQVIRENTRVLYQI